MPSLFVAENNRSVIERIQQLTPETQPLWGKMTVSQMLAHCQAPIRVYFGETKSKRGLIGILFGGIAKKKMINEQPFQKNLPTDPNFLTKRPLNFHEEKGKLISLVARIGEETNYTPQATHPFFGKMNKQEWDILAWKHLDHHLRQFGV